MSIELREIPRIPRTSWDLPGDVMHIQLGCTGCIHTVRFEAVGVSSFLPEHSRNSEDVKDLLAITDNIEKGQSVLQASAHVWLDPCEGDCPSSSDIASAVEMLNERFGSSLVVPS